jgi:hypothetical protein
MALPLAGAAAGIGGAVGPIATAAANAVVPFARAAPAVAAAADAVAPAAGGLARFGPLGLAIAGGLLLGAAGRALWDLWNAREGGGDAPLNQYDPSTWPTARNGTDMIYVFNICGRTYPGGPLVCGTTT